MAGTSIQYDSSSELSSIAGGGDDRIRVLAGKADDDGTADAGGDGCGDGGGDGVGDGVRGGRGDECWNGEDS